MLENLRYSIRLLSRLLLQQQCTVALIRCPVLTKGSMTCCSTVPRLPLRVAIVAQNPWC